MADSHPAELFVRYVQPWLPDLLLRLLVRAACYFASALTFFERWPQQEFELVERLKAQSAEHAAAQEGGGGGGGAAAELIAVETAAANAQHYEVPTAFFEACLGPRLKYSACEWPAGVSTLRGAEEHTLDKYVRMLGVADGERVLDIGCGWGSFTLYAAARFPRAEFVCFSNSATQRAHIAARAAALGLGNVRALRLDLNELSAEALAARGVAGRPFDRAIACESLEHARNYASLFRALAPLLAPRGALLVQILGHREASWLMSGSSWMGRNFFSGGTVPSMRLFALFSEHLRVTRAWAVDGREYARTLDAWLGRLYAERGRCLRALGAEREPSEARHRYEKWRTFFVVCSECFGMLGGREYMVGYLLMQRADAPVTAA